MSLPAAADNATAVFQRLQARARQVRSFTADVSIDVNIPSFTVPPSRGILRVRIPDSIEFASKHLTFVPKNGWNLSPFVLLQRRDFLVLDGGSQGKSVLLRLYPTSDSGEVVAAKLVVDLRDTVVTQAEVITRSAGTVTLAMDYGTYRQLHLPSRITMTFAMLPINLPRTLTGDIASMQTPRPKTASVQGSVTITFERYSSIERMR